MLKRNLIANYLGQGWTALMSLAFIPLYIKYLGIESYGLIGLFAVLTTWLSLLDMGMTPTLGREMARLTGGSHTAESIRDLLRSIEIIALVIALAMAGSIVLGSNWIATSWLKAEELPASVVADAFAIMGIITAFRFLEGIYRSSIIGLQRQVLFNAVNSCMATLRGLGAVAILAWVSSTIQAFFLWQGFISIVTLVILATTTYTVLPRSTRGARFSLYELRAVWRFSGGMLLITLLVLTLTSIDKILLSTLVPLSEYGYYALASVVAGSLYFLSMPVNQAYQPRLAQLYAANNHKQLAASYHQAAQVVSVLSGSAAMIIIAFSDTILIAWTQDYTLAENVAPILRIIAFGTMLNIMMGVPYITQLAYGWTQLTVITNAIAILILLPAILIFVPIYGVYGAVYVWLGLNVGYFLIAAPFMFRRILTSEKRTWYFSDVLVPLSASAATVFFFRVISLELHGSLAEIIFLLTVSLCTVLISVLSAPEVRKFGMMKLKKYANQRR